MSIESTASELRSRANDLRSDTNWDPEELAEHLSAMATELEDAARRYPRRPVLVVPGMER